MRYINHYTIGFNEINHRNKTIATSLISSKFQDYMEDLKNKEFDVGFIPAGYEHRPDLISDLFYNTVTNDWIIMAFNNISDPFQELNVGDKILIPKL